MNRLKSQLIFNCNYIGFYDTNIVFSTNDYSFKNIISNYSGICNTFELENCNFYDDILNILLEKLISSNIKNIILKNCNAIDTIFLYNTLKKYNIVLFKNTCKKKGAVFLEGFALTWSFWYMLDMSM